MFILHTARENHVLDANGFTVCLVAVVNSQHNYIVYYIVQSITLYVSSRFREQAKDNR